MTRGIVLSAVLLAALLSACGRTAPAAKSGGAAAVTHPGMEGFWQGTLNTGAIPLRLVFKIHEQPDGKLTGTLDSLDQGAKDIPLSAVSVNGSSVSFEVKVVGGGYEGTLSRSGAEITGEWHQNGASLPLTLTRVDKLPVVRRPQEPKRPYPYRDVEVAYDNKPGHSHMAGTLTLPRSGAPFPAALLITGSGQQDRDEAIMGHRPFLVLADYLTRRGIAVLRVDDRGVGGSTGEVAKATTEDFAGDVLAGVAYLKTRPEIDPKKIGLIGHSEGGIIAPMCAAKSKDVAFIVLMAGSGVPGEQILYEQGALILKATGASPEMIAQQRAAQERIYAVLKREKDDTIAARQLREIFAEAPVHSTPDPAKAAAAAKEQPAAKPGHLPAAQEASLRMMLSPWFRFFLTYDPRPALRQVKCPVLAINGERDLQVPPKENLPAIETALQASHNRDVTIKEIPKLNHLFQTCQTGSPAEYGQIGETFAPVALNIIGDWIVQRMLKAPAH